MHTLYHSYKSNIIRRFLFGAVAGIFFLCLASNFHWFQSYVIDSNDSFNVGQPAGEDEQVSFLFSLFLGGIVFGALLVFFAKYGAFVNFSGISVETLTLIEGTAIRAPPLPYSFSSSYIN